jgi:predicted transcriptional regulator
MRQDFRTRLPVLSMGQASFWVQDNFAPGEPLAPSGSLALFSFALPHTQFSRTLKGMEVHFSPDVEARLQQLASANGRDAEQLVKDTVARMLENQASFIAGVRRGIEQADRGEFVEHKDVLNRLDRLFPA